MSGSRDLALVAVLASAASASLTLLVGGALRPEAPPAAPALTAADFKAALADLESQVEGLRREMAERGGSAPAWVAPSAPGPRPPGALSPAPGGGAAEPLRTGQDNAALEPTPAHLLRFREFFDVDEVGDRRLRPEARRRWLFRGERDVAEWFGIPEVVGMDESGSETWTYEIPTGEKDEEGEPVTETYWIRLNRGRVIDLGE
jgi:hypothetical protein